MAFKDPVARADILHDMRNLRNLHGLTVFYGLRSMIDFANKQAVPLGNSNQQKET